MGLKTWQSQHMLSFKLPKPVINQNSVTQDQILISHLKGTEGNDGNTSLKAAVDKHQVKTIMSKREDAEPEKISSMPTFKNFVCKVTKNAEKTNSSKKI